jgi:uncharacterized membrane protein YeaQ/YmgE (transglycosylase-associated protein family)
MKILGAIIFGWLAGTLAQMLTRGTVTTGFWLTAFLGMVGGALALFLAALISVPIVEITTLLIVAVLGAIGVLFLLARVFD